MAKNNIQKFQLAIKIILTLQTILAFLAVFFLIFLQDSMIIGVGQFENFIHKIESIEFRWWLLTAAIVFLLLSSASSILFFIFDLSGLEINQLKESIYKLVKGKNIPVRVDIDERIKIALDKPVIADFSVDTKIALHESMHIETIIPIDISFPVDTTFETKILGIGKVKIPIKTIIPIKIDFPFQGEVNLKMQGFNLKLKESAEVELPPLEVPVKCRMEAVLNLESNLQKVEESLFKSDS